MAGKRLGIAMGVLCVSGPVLAQGSVTLFGMLDEGLNYTSNAGGKSAWQMASVDLATSRWGLKGDEPLGGGLHGIFDLESAFTVENGQTSYGGRLFGYQSYVGLRDDSAGTLTAGRQFDSISDVLGPLTANGSWAGYLFTHPLDNDNTDGTFHASNALKYTSPSWAGFSGSATYGFSNQPGAFANNRMYSVGLGYAGKALTAGVVYGDLKGAGSTAGGAVSDDDFGFASRRQKIWGVGANYTAGQWKGGLVYTHTNVDRAGSSIYTGDIAGRPDLRFDNVEANLRYDLTPSFFVGGMYTYTRAQVSGGPAGNRSVHWNEAGLMAQYNLSARTAIYAQSLYQRYSGDALAGLGGAYVPGAASPSSNSHQVVSRVALVHAF